jgi:hypothetical protein
MGVQWVGTLHPRGRSSSNRGKRQKVCELGREGCGSEVAGETGAASYRHTGLRSESYGCLRLVVSKNRHSNHEYIVTNDPEADLRSVVERKMSRWSIETLFPGR